MAASSSACSDGSVATAVVVLRLCEFAFHSPASSASLFSSSHTPVRLQGQFHTSSFCTPWVETNGDSERSALWDDNVMAVAMVPLPLVESMYRDMWDRGYQQYLDTKERSSNSSTSNGTSSCSESEPGAQLSISLVCQQEEGVLPLGAGSVHLSTILRCPSEVRMSMALTQGDSEVSGAAKEVHHVVDLTFRYSVVQTMAVTLELEQVRLCANPLAGQLERKNIELDSSSRQSSVTASYLTLDVKVDLGSTTMCEGETPTVDQEQHLLRQHPVILNDRHVVWTFPEREVQLVLPLLASGEGMTEAASASEGSGNFSIHGVVYREDAVRVSQAGEHPSAAEPLGCFYTSFPPMQTTPSDDGNGDVLLFSSLLQRTDASLNYMEEEPDSAAAAAEPIRVLLHARLRGGLPSCVAATEEVLQAAIALDPARPWLAGVANTTSCDSECVASVLNVTALEREERERIRQYFAGQMAVAKALRASITAEILLLKREMEEEDDEGQTDVEGGPTALSLLREEQQRWGREVERLEGERRQEDNQLEVLTQQTEEREGVVAKWENTLGCCEADLDVALRETADVWKELEAAQSALVGFIDSELQVYLERRDALAA